MFLQLYLVAISAALTVATIVLVFLRDGLGTKVFGISGGLLEIFFLLVLATPQIHKGFTFWVIAELLAIDVVLVSWAFICLLYTSPSPRDGLLSRMPSSA